MQEVFEKILERLEDVVSIQKMNGMERRVGKRQTQGFGLGVRIAKEIVQEIAEEHNNSWIPVSNRLPNQDGEFADVLITCESMVDGVFVQSAEFYIASDGEPVFDALYHYERVIAWQPLPLPYKECDHNAKV